jgi:hypothetical protein
MTEEMQKIAMTDKQIEKTEERTDEIIEVTGEMTWRKIERREKTEYSRG